MVLTLPAPTFAHQESKLLMSGGRGKGEVEELVDRINRQTHTLDLSLYKRLTAIGTQESLEAIKKVCSKLNNATALPVAYASLENYKGDEKLEAKAIDWLADECGASKPPTHQAAAKALVLFGSSATSELQGLVSRSKYASVRAIAVGGVLEDYVSENTSDALAALLANAEVGLSGSHGALFGALDRFEGEEFDSDFAAGLKNKKAPVSIKRVAIEVLKHRERQEVTKMLISALKDKATEVQIAAMVALDDRGEESHEGAVYKLLKSKDEAVRRQAIISLGRLKGADEDWLDDLNSLAKDRDPGTRMGAAVALAELRTPEALEALYLLLADTDHLVRREALQQLGNMRRKETLPRLMMRLNGERGRLKTDLLITLRLITGLDHGTSYERWKRWWDAEGEAFELPSYETALRAERERKKRAGEGRTATSFYGLTIVSDRICFVLDVSGSMEGASGSGTRMEAAKEQLMAVLGAFPEGDLFNVIFFSSDAFPWEDELVTMNKKTRKAALSYVERQTPGGATAIYDALELAFEDRRIDTIFLLTDGEPSGGKIDDAATIRSEVKRWNANRHIRINCIAIGKPSTLLQGLAKDTGGEYKQVN